MKHPHEALRPSIKVLFQVGVSLLLAVGVGWFIVRNGHEMVEGLHLLGHLPLSAVSTALALVGVAFVLAALSYQMLAFRRLRFSELLTIELASSFINRLVPSGVGGLGIHGLYLHHRKHTIPQATAVVSTNNLLGMVMHVLLLVLLLAFLGNPIGLRLRWSATSLLLALALGFVVVAVLLMRSVRWRISRFLHNLLVSLRRYSAHPHVLVFAALALVGLTLTNLLVLQLMARAVGIELDSTQLFLVYSAGLLVGVIVPTPGGLAGVETGLVAGFAAYGVPNEATIAATLAFRLVTYWIPLLPGAAAFMKMRFEKILLS